jgi:hypothetical protein
MLPIPELAADTVGALKPYLSAAAIEGAKKLGPLCVVTRLDKYEAILPVPKIGEIEVSCF